MARPKKFDEADTLQKALHVFWKKGYAGTSMSDLVVNMNINAPSLYATYGDKQQLFLLALKNYQCSQVNWIEELAARPIPVKEIISILLKALVEDTLNDPERKGCFMVNTITELANRDEEVLQIATENEIQIRSILAGLIRKGQSVGEISESKDPNIIAAYLFTSMMGVRVISATNSDKAMLDAVLKFAVSSI